MRHKLPLVLFMLFTSGCSSIPEKPEPKKQQHNVAYSQDLAFEIINRLNTVVYRSERKKELVTSFIKNYFQKMYAIEIQIADEMAKPNEDRNKMDKLLANKREVFEAFWLLDDKQRVKFYYPSSWSSTPHHDWTKVKNIKLYETGDDIKPQFLFSYTYNEKPFGDAPYTYAIKYENNKLLITDYYFEL